MNRKTLITLHGYIAVFFLPLAVLYAATGVLYILGSKGVLTEKVMTVELDGGWPGTLDEGRAIASQRLAEEGLPVANSVAGEFEINDDEYYWRALSHGVRLTRVDNSTAEVRLQQNDLLRQFVEIHKNHAGPWFRILGIAFGAGMLILIVSGAWMMFQSRTYRRSATALFAGGVIASLSAYLATILANG